MRKEKRKKKTFGFTSFLGLFILVWHITISTKWTKELKDSQKIEHIRRTMLDYFTLLQLRYLNSLCNNYLSQRRGGHEPPTLTAYHFSLFHNQDKISRSSWTPDFTVIPKTSASGLASQQFFKAHPRESVGNWKPPLYFSRPQISTELCLKTSSFRSNTCHFPNNAIR